MSLTPAAWRLAITSGKGGVGKTSVTVHLAAALAAAGARVGIVDADLALGNVDVRLGLTPRGHLGHVLAGERSIDEVLLEGPAGIRVAPAGSGVRSLTTLDDAQWTRLAGAVDALSRQVDVVLLDTATGVSDSVLDVIALADCALVVTTFDPAALVDAYALVKLVDAFAAPPEIGVLVNAVQQRVDGDTAFRQLAMVSERFLGRALRDAGAIAHDPDVSRAAQALTVLGAGPLPGARRGFRDLAVRLLSWAPGGAASLPRVRPPRAAVLAARLTTEEAPCA